MSTLRELCDEGPRVIARTARAADVDRYRRAVLASRDRLARWNPVDPGDLQRHLVRQSDVHRTFLVLARDDEGGHGVVGRVNLTNVVRGRFQSGVLGYDAFDPYAGRGLFAEGLALVVGLALRAPAAGGVGLHRVEANVQPGNVTSAGLLRSLGFRHEGHTPRMLLLGAPADGERWRDHDRYAVTVEEWPPAPYQRHGHRRLVVLVGGPDADRRSALAAGLAVELGLPLLAGADLTVLLRSSDGSSFPASRSEAASSTATSSVASSAGAEPSAETAAPDTAGVRAAISASGGRPRPPFAAVTAAAQPATVSAGSGPAAAPTRPAPEEPLDAAREATGLGPRAPGDSVAELSVGAEAVAAPSPAADAAPVPAPAEFELGSASGSRSGSSPASPGGSPGAAVRLDADLLWAVLAGCCTGAVVDLPWRPAAAPEVQAGLHRAGIRVADAVQVWCGSALAGVTDRAAGWGLPLRLELDPVGPLTAREVTRVALAARALAAR